MKKLSIPRVKQHLLKKNFSKAIQEGLALIKLENSNAEAWHVLGQAYQQTQQYKPALDCFKKSLSLKEDEEYIFSVAHAYMEMGEGMQAENFFQKLETSDYQRYRNYTYRVVNLFNSKLYHEIIEKSETLKMGFNDQQSNIFELALLTAVDETNAILDLKQEDRVVSYQYLYKKLAKENNECLVRYTKKADQEDIDFLIELKLDFEKSNNNFAINYVNGKLAELENKKLEAAEYYKNALSNYWNQLVAGEVTNYFIKNDLIEDITKFFETSYQQKPEDYISIFMLSSLYYTNAAHLNKSVALFKKGKELFPDNTPIQWNAAHPFFDLGNLKEGWECYRHREGIFLPRAFDATIWQGDSNPDISLLVWSEQGVGDHILFASVLNDLKNKRELRKIIFETDPRLIKLMQRSFPEIHVRKNPRLKKDKTPYITDYTHHIPAGTLPYFFRQDFSDFPSEPYLKVSAKWLEFWKQRLPKKEKKIVGIAWKSGVRNAYRDKYLMDIEQFAPIFEVENIIWVNLQYGDCSNEIEYIREKYGKDLLTWEDINLKDDFDAVAALMLHIDLVISAPTAVMQLAGAIGANLWAFISHPSGFGMFGQDYMPWFPKARVYQTELPTPIFHAIPKIKEDLLCLVNGEILSPGKILCEKTTRETIAENMARKNFGIYYPLAESEILLSKGLKSIQELSEKTVSIALQKHLQGFIKNESPFEEIKSDILNYGNNLKNYNPSIPTEKIMEQEFKFRPENSDTLVIFFQGNETRALPFTKVTPYFCPKFSHSKTIEYLSSKGLKFSSLQIRDSWQMWYQVGPLGSALSNQERAQESWVSLINHYIELSSAKRIICVGTSAGGSAAIWFADALNAEKIIAISPQAHILDMQWEKENTGASSIGEIRSWQLDVISEFNLKPFHLQKISSSNQRLDILIPKNNYYDLCNAREIMGEKNFDKVISCSGKEHAKINKTIFLEHLMKVIAHG